MDIIKTNPDKPWYWYEVSKNPNVTFEIINEHLKRCWNWISISSNPMTKEKNDWITKIRHQIIKSNMIKRYWRNCTCDPRYLLAQKLILQRAEIDT